MTKNISKVNGFTIAEMLVALAVLAILLTAVAIAFNASAQNYNENTEMFKALNAGRQAMMRMTNQFRTAESIPQAIYETDPNHQCSFYPVPDPNQVCRFRYDNNSKAVYLDTGGNSYLLCDHVTSMIFNRWESAGEVKGIQMAMTVTVGGDRQAITGAAVLRKKL